ncbi:TRAP transporter small permease [Consotaella aegiceratis]|uniref:TRAP transporter small permease n=1 Tax=Consotaella aegiceratis TaxID=3097961 RepID=UPI002F3EAF74
MLETFIRFIACLYRLFAAIDRVFGVVCAIISGVAIVFMASVAFVDSIGRELNHPLQGGDEYVSFALLVFFFASLPLVVRDDAHIRVGLFAELYKRRLATMERVFTGVVEALALCVFTWMLFDQASRLNRFGTLTVFFQMPVAPWVFLGSVLSLVATWFAFRDLWMTHVGPIPRPHAIPDYEDQ